MQRLKRFGMLLAAGTLIGLAFSLALAQVPASFLRSGMIFGTPKAVSGVSGTAVFTASTGAITGATYTGCITGVTYNGVGNYLVALSGCPAHYVVAFGSSDNTQFPLVMISPVSSYTASSFNIEVCNTACSAFFDPPLLFITIP